MSFLEVIEYQNQWPARRIYLHIFNDICIYVYIHAHTYAYMGYHIEYTHTHKSYLYVSSLHFKHYFPTSQKWAIPYFKTNEHDQLRCLLSSCSDYNFVSRTQMGSNWYEGFLFFFSEGFVQIPTVLQIRICGLYPKFSEKKGLSWRLDWLFSSFEVRFAFSCFHFMALSTGATLPLYDDAGRGGHGKGQQGRTVGEFLELWEWRWGQSCMDGFGASIHCTVHDSKRSWLLSTRHETSSLSGHKTQLLLCCLYFCFILALLGMKSLVFHTN